ncbi:hypothetical protein HG536_0H02030 [Torulaspora globosa]|uniref:Ribosome assembly protein 3 n=1 Tax=Torulaspora globosa TaxID=48254 RepID=A0A7G3ZMU2_9SACH|nr:uncharacterized protein HG536_0H02030 [Torulaspora globosa]QLL34828.1 hypothetical protein HG536_0H02030 [Torulaspora globosa]
MAEGEVRAAKSAAKKSRRRKKRRTADVSDSSDSDSCSDNDYGRENNKSLEEVKEEDIQLTDDEAIGGPEVSKETSVEKLDDEVRDQLNAIPFTRTELTDRTDHIKGQGADLVKVKRTLEEDRKKLSSALEGQRTSRTDAENKNAYLSIMFENYGEEINSLRDAPDFTNKSLVMLANVLKDGTGMFDVDTLKTILN